jgi:hypothetical protein
VTAVCDADCLTATSHWEHKFVNVSLWNIIPFFKQCCSKVVDVVWRVRTSTYASIQIIPKMFNWVQIRTFWGPVVEEINVMILQTQRVLQATTCIYVCTSKWYPWTTGTYFAKVSFLVQYIISSSLIFCILLPPIVPYGVKRFYAPCSSTSCVPNT